MLRGISALRRFTIAATDGNLGSVGDVCFDDRSWGVRYLVVDPGIWLPTRRVLVSPTTVRSSDPTTFHVALSKEQVAAGPDFNTCGMPGPSMEQLGGEPAGPTRHGPDRDAHLQTATAVMGYAVQTEDGKIGHVEDVLVDDQAWAIRYLVVDTENRWVGKRVLVSPAWLTHVTWDASKTLCCIATAVDDGIGGGGQRFHRSSIGNRW
jgi:sporulation protein YlmC with PRC-barrel domain